MANYELIRRFFRQALNKNLKVEIRPGTAPLSLPHYVQLPPSSDVIGSIVCPNSSYEIVLKDAKTSEQIARSFINQLRSSGWNQLFSEDEGVDYQHSSTISKAQLERGVFEFVNVRNASFLRLDLSKKLIPSGLYYVSIQSNLSTQESLFLPIPHEVREQIGNFTIPLLSDERDRERQTIHTSSSDSDFYEIGLIESDADITDISEGYSHQLIEAGWVSLRDTTTGSIHSSSWILRAGANQSQLSLNLYSVDKYISVFQYSVEDISRHYYPYLSLQAEQQNLDKEEIADSFTQSLVNIILNESSVQVSDSRDLFHLPIDLPLDSVLIGSASEDSRCMLFADIPASPIQINSYFERKLSDLGWRESPIPWKGSGKGIAGSGYNYSMPRCFFSPAKQERTQLAIRTFSTSSHHTDVEIVQESKELPVMPNDYFSDFSKDFLNYPIPVLLPYQDSLTEIISESLANTVYRSVGYIQSSVDMVTIETYYKQQFSSQGWIDSDSTTAPDICLSLWKKEGVKGKHHYASMSLVKIDDRSQDYSIQICITPLGEELISQGIGHKLMSIFR